MSNAYTALEETNYFFDIQWKPQMLNKVLLTFSFFSCICVIAFSRAFKYFLS